MSNDSIKEKFLLNYHLRYRRRVSILFLISITLVFSPLYLLPLAYSQEFSFIPIFRESGIPEARLSGPAGIAIDPSSGNVYVADTANNRIQVFSNRTIGQ